MILRYLIQLGQWLKAGEFILGYADEMGFTPPPPKPEVLGSNGTYAVVRKLRQRVSEFRRFLKAHASSPEEEERLAAKMAQRGSSRPQSRPRRSGTGSRPETQQ